MEDDASFSDSPEGATAAAKVINNTYGYLRDADGSPCDFVEILSHRGKDIASLEFELRWSNGQQTFAPLRLVKMDQPAMVARYVLKQKITCDSHE
jgi:hypothetical protein